MRATPLLLAPAMLFAAACGEIIVLGSQGEPLSPPLLGDCPLQACGAQCDLVVPCTTTECPPDVSGFCDVEAHCTINVPDCPLETVDPRCTGQACGAQCDPCDPADPSCTPSADAGPGNPPLFCDAKQQCQPAPITCD